MVINPEFVSESQVLALDSDYTKEAEEEIVNAVELQGIKLLSSFDVADLFQVGYIHAMYPWNRPKGYCLTIYLPVIPIVGADDVIMDPVPMMIGVVIDRSLTPILSAHQDAIYAKMEEFLPDISEITAKMIQMPQDNDMDQLIPLLSELKSLLRQLRQKIDCLLKTWMDVLLLETSE